MMFCSKQKQTPSPPLLISWRRLNATAQQTYSERTRQKYPWVSQIASVFRNFPTGRIRPRHNYHASASFQRPTTTVTLFQLHSIVARGPWVVEAARRFTDPQSRVSRYRLSAQRILCRTTPTTAFTAARKLAKWWLQLWIGISRLGNTGVTLARLN